MEGLQEMRDVREIFCAIFRNDPDTLDEIFKITTPSSLYENLGQKWHIRIDGVVKALEGTISTITEHVGHGKSAKASWVPMIWGSINMLLKLSNQNYELQSKFVSMLEGLTTMIMLPRPPTRKDGQQAYLRGVLLQVIAELVESLANMVVFLRQSPPGKVLTTKWTNLEIEQRNTATRIDTVSKWINGTSLDCQTIRLKSLDELLNINVTPDEIAKLPCRMVPYTASQNFFARSYDLQQIRDIYAASANKLPIALSLYGLPGVGKTQLALKYAQLNESKYSAVFWIPSDTAIKISEAYSIAVRKLRLPGWDLRVSRSSEAATLVAWLQETDVPWLLIFDNVDDIDILREFWPAAGNGNIIITSRDPATAVCPASNGIHVEPFSHNDSLEFFLKITGYGSCAKSSALPSIVSEWGGLPLALNQIGSLIWRQQLSPEAFQKLYRKDSIPFYSKKVSDWNYDSSIATVMSISILQLSPNARKILHLLCFFDPDNIPGELLLDSFDDGAALASLMSPFDYIDALTTLQKTSLVDQNRRHLTIHRLVQSILFAALTFAERDQSLDLVVDIFLASFPLSGFSRNSWKEWETCERYLPHVVFLGDRFLKNATIGPKSAKLAELLSRCTWYMFERGYFTEAVRLVQIAEGACADSQSPIAAEIFEALASLRGECNRIDESTDLLCKTLSIRERLLSPSDPLLAYSYKNVGLVLSCQGNFEKAFSCFEKAFSCVKGFREPNPIAAAGVFGNLGVYYMLKGEYDDAVVNLERALTLTLEASAEGDDHYAERVFYLGNVRLRQGLLDESLKLHEKCLVLRSKILPAHDKTGFSYHKVALIQYRKGFSLKARENLERAIAIFEKNYDNAPRLARSKYLLAQILRDIGKIDKAQVMSSQAAKLLQEIKTFPISGGTEAEIYDSLAAPWLG